MYFLMSILVVILSCGQTSAVVDKRFPTNRNGDKMTNVVEKDDFLFVAENGILHELDLGLTSIKSFNTCASDNCNNINEVLAVSGDLLVLCGTGNNGVCQAFEDEEVKYSSSSDSSDSNYLTVSTNINTPAVGIAFEGQFYFGRGLKSKDGRTYRNYITRTRIADNFTNTGSANISGEEHLIYFRNVFQHNRSISFLTNQRDNLAPNKMASKLIRIDVDKPYGANRNLSYTETVLICQAEGDDYNLLQDGAYLPANGVLVAAFSKGDDPENPLSNSAVCVYNITVLSEELHTDLVGLKHGCYIDKNSDGEGNEGSLNFIVMSTVSHVPSRFYKARMSAKKLQNRESSVLKLNNTRITKVKGIDRYGLYPDVFIGTDNGSVIKLSVNNALQLHVYKASTTIDEGHPVTDIHFGEDKDYAVTNRKISSFKNTKCSIFNTCKETLAVRNPSCGWCLIGSTGTKKSDCPSGWISPFSECVSINASPKYVAVSEISTTELRITAQNIPENVSTEVKCRYFDRGVQQGGLIPADRKEKNTFSCSIFSKPEHVELTLQLIAFNGSNELFIYAETTIQIYDCVNFTTCGNCLQSPEINCSWCGKDLTCQSESSCSINMANKCPMMKEAQKYIPNGITKDVTLEVANMVSGLEYKCIVVQNGTYTGVSATIEGNNITCPLNVTYDTTDAKVVIPLTVNQTRGQLSVKIKGSVDVTVYKCNHLVPDCTKCRAIKTDLYDCKWCEGGPCGHSSECNSTETCPCHELLAIICRRPRGGFVEEVGEKNVTFKFNGVEAGYGLYSIKSPFVNKIEPSFGAAIGGTLVTLSGTDLHIEARVPSLIRLGATAECDDISYNNEKLTCTTTQLGSGSDFISFVRLYWALEYYNSSVNFYSLPTPSITKLPIAKSIVSGGLNLIAVGTSLKSVAKVSINAEYAGNKTVDTCIPSSETSMNCNLPVAPRTVVDEMVENSAGKRRRRKRSTGVDSIKVEVTIKMDGYTKTFDVDYYRDPVVESFLETTTVSNTGERILTITGNYLNLTAGPDDYTVSIGVGNCLVKEVARTYITCSPPQDNLNKTAEQLKVVVQLGYFKQDVGYVKYEIVRDDNPVQNILIVVLPIVGGLLLVGIIVGTIGTCKYQRIKSTAKKLEKNISDMEMKIKKVFRGEFLEMHSAMTHVSENLVEKGFPYNNYQRYTFLFLFPGEWHMNDHPLMHEPDVPCGKQVGLNQGMDTFKQLLLNKFFLVSVISTMEKQRKFFAKERSIMAGHLSVALLGKMEYFHEILTVLLTTLVDETPQKQQKTLFRRCESITENMMNNWLALSLYPHVKMHSGSPLYMLFKGTQLTMESGPIDAVTGDSKYTLSEEKLLRQDAKYNTLTLKMLVENSDEIRECKVLECDTVSQVKAKCLNQIYVNYSASQLTVEPSDLDLQWHWGNSGRLLLQDEDTTSKRDGNSLQLNTMEHYKVVDGSSMALIDPDGFDKEDYANTADITIDTSGFDHSRSKEHLTLDYLENGESIKRWHLVKPDEERQSAGCVVTDEFYITRLITTKQSVLGYMKTLFDTILDTTIPPPVKFLFDFLDNAGQKNKAQGDALHAWKSQCYLIRFWAALVDKPYYLFDQKISPYVETSMEVISQVLIESCSLKAQQYTKDSSPGKLIFKNDMMTYREKVKNYYEKVRQAKQEESELRQYLTDLNKFQRHQTHYNRHAALYSLYTQLKPYMGEILDDLENDEDTKSLGLDKKLKDLNTLMGLEQ